MITGRQIRAGRALLDLSQEELAKAAGMTKQGISKIEDGSVQPREGTIADIMRVFRDNGVEFTQDEGVKLKSDGVTKLEGSDGLAFFLDQVYLAALQPYSRDGTKPICICNLDNSFFRKHMGSRYPAHAERMQRIDGLKIRSLSAAPDKEVTTLSPYLEYRYLEKLGALIAPFYVFGDNFALLDFKSQNAPKILLIRSDALAESYRNQFDIMWNDASVGV